MKYSIYNALLFLTVLLSATGAHAQPGDPAGSEEFVIDALDVGKGLISNFVTRTVHDDNNLKYFATEGGISRYDGYSFKSYRPGPEYPGLGNENIETLFKDRDNNIWIGTKSGGLSVLDVRTNRIHSVNHLFTDQSHRHLQVIAINQDGRGNIWIGTWSKGVFVLDINHRKVLAHYPSNRSIFRIVRDEFNNMWYIAGSDLFKYDPSESRLLRFPTPHVIYDLVNDRSRHALWLVGNKGRTVHLQRFNSATQTLTQQPVNFDALFVKSIALDSKNRIWLGSWGDGLYISDTTISTFRKINTTPQGSPVSNVNYARIVAIDIDANGIGWLSMAYGGVLILYPNKGFNLIADAKQLPEVDHNVIAMHQAATGDLLVGTIADGLYRKPAGSDRFERISQIPKTRINGIYAYGNTLFIASRLGLHIVRDGRFGEVIHTFKDEKVTAVLVDSRQNIWLGTQQKGLKMTHLPSDPRLERCIVYAEDKPGRLSLENNRINQIKEDQQGNIWLATYSGLNRLDRATGAFIPHQQLVLQPLPSVIINALVIRNDTLYLATPLGLAELLVQNEKLRLNALYNSRNGLTNEFVCSIEAAPGGQLWLSTTTAIARYNPRSKRFVNYDREDGVMINSFHIGSSARTAAGELYFGGSNGIIAFKPNDMGTRFTVPEVVWSKLVINNRTVEVGEPINGQVVLTRDIQYTDRIDLSYQHNYVSVSYAANDFFGADNITYAYTLRGFQDSWVNMGNRSQLSLTGLGSGTYQLLIKASRNNQNWGPVKSLTIVVGVPPWLSWYAFMLYAGLLGGVLLLVRNVSIRQARLKADLRIVQIEKEKEHDLNEAKINFFTNISHEFRTPLTLIMSPVAEILDDNGLGRSLREKLVLVEANARRMLNLINQLLDFRKAEHGLLVLNLVRSDLVPFAREVFLSFGPIARKKNISYSFEVELDNAFVDFDRGQMEIVLCNLLSNAFKYTPNNGAVQCRVYRQGDAVGIDVQDNGIGLSADDMEKVFDRFYQVRNAQTATMIGSGLGLTFSKNIVDLHGGQMSVRSQLNNGTCFTVLLRAEVLTDVTARQPTQAPAGYQPPPETESLSASRSDKRETVLVVDDNDDIRMYLRLLLRDEFDLIEAADGLDALAIANRELPDLIISDVMMPQLDGIAFCQAIKGQMATSHIPVILLTARSSVVYEVSGLQTGADDYITKPFNPLVIRTRIRAILENRKKLREHFFNRVRFEPDAQQINEVDLDAVFISKAMQLVNENLHNEEFGIEIMIEQLNMSQSTLYRKIKSLTGLSLTGFIRSVKLKQAAQLILQQDVKISQVAFEVGFNDYKHFRKSFQQQFGCLPSEYRASVAKGVNPLLQPK